jgi:hypothetical protein
VAKNFYMGTKTSRFTGIKLLDVYVSRGKVGYFLGFPEKVSTIYMK